MKGRIRSLVINVETRLSKTLSYFLRHAPEKAQLDMDDQGFVSMDQLVDALQERGWDELTVESLVQQVDDPGVERFERKGEAVRAKYGHSVEVDLDYSPVDPPSRLYHGTSPNAWRSIRRKGLKPMNRQYVHLSTSLADARRVGSRHSDRPVILAVDVPERTDRAFYRAGPVILTDFIPLKWINRID